MTVVDPKLAVPVMVRLVNVPAAAVDAPIGVLLIVDAVIAKACKAEDAIIDVPSEAIIATL